MHPLNDGLPGSYVPVRVTRDALVAHRYTYTPPRCRTSQYYRTFVPLSVSLWNDLADPCSMVWDWRISRAGQMFFYWYKLLYPCYSLLFFPFFFFLSIGWCCGAGVIGVIGCIPLFLSLALPTSFDINTNNTEIDMTAQPERKLMHLENLRIFFWPYLENILLNQT